MPKANSTIRVGDIVEFTDDTPELADMRGSIGVVREIQNTMVICNWISCGRLNVLNNHAWYIYRFTKLMEAPNGTDR